MRYGIVFANTGPLGTAEGAVALAEACDAHGVESVWTVEHVLVPGAYESEYPYSSTGKMPGSEDSPIPDPLIWLTWVAAHSSTVKLGTGVLILPQRNPAVLARKARIVREVLAELREAQLLAAGASAGAISSLDSPPPAAAPHPGRPAPPPPPPSPRPPPRHRRPATIWPAAP